MRFLLDAHLPPALCSLLRAAGHDARHTSSLPEGNRTTDQVINRLSQNDDLVVVTKDTDFYYSHLLYGRPPRLVTVQDGEPRNTPNTRKESFRTSGFAWFTVPALALP